MRIAFEHEGERSCVLNTLRRLISEINERSHTTAEVENLHKAIRCVEEAPTFAAEASRP